MIMGVFNFSVLLFHLCCVTFILTFHFDISIGSSLKNLINAFVPSECEALLKFKHHLVDPSNRLSSWNASNSNCCHWNGVVCSTDHVTTHVLQLHLSTSEPSISYDDHVVYFFDEYEEALAEYKSLRFGGEINESLVELKHLNHLDLSGNDFGGQQIPTFLGEMTSLVYLNLSGAGFGGNIPQQIGNLSNLLFLDLSFAAFGKIPSQIGNLTNLLQLHLPSDSMLVENLHWLSGLSHLQYLDLRYVNLSKSLDWLHNLQALPSLTNLRLSSCTFPNHYNQPSSTSSFLNFSSHITTLDFSNSNLILNSSSVVSKWIFGLRKLVSLRLRDNEIQGPIPNGIQNLTLIENLDLSWNSLSSSIPDWLYSLHHLKFLNLYENNLCGNISDDIGNLTSLVKLDLSYNSQIAGRIPTSFGNLCNLREIDFSYLKLNQQVNEILEILTPCVSQGLTTLTISSSHLLGNVTDQIAKFKNLVVIDFYDNSIHGALPKLFGELSSLRSLDISLNQLSGNPFEFLRSLSKLSSLRTLDISLNQFNGALPKSFGELSSLRSLDISRNQFSGNPFEFLRSLSKLSYISIKENLFEGVVKEDDLANLTSLKTFYASRNNITLEVSPNWHPGFQLFDLDMSSWKLGPKFPSWIQSQKNLQYLFMSNTSISDVIPPLFWQTISQLRYLDLSNNHIHGELPHTLITSLTFLDRIDLSKNNLSGRLPHLSNHVVWLDISSNLFSGTMTDFLCREQGTQMDLQFLNLASNNLSGKIPDCWRWWTNLAEVHLESNHFVGNLPPSMGSIDWLQSLHIGNNSLSGTFPHCLKNTTQLISLVLGGNKFTGIIPAWVGEKLSSLKILFLRSNKFLGDIPNEICALNNLQVLDLAQNNLSGIIPSCFNRFSVMTQKNKSRDSTIGVDGLPISYSITMLLLIKGREDEYKNNLGLVTSIDLSGNNLLGEIPKEITNLDALLFLNLSHNQLVGHIPSSIGNMGSLLSIDISRNELSGEIPQSITNLSFLSMLNLSYNHLIGEIPMGTQIQSFNASNFVGNNLCGPPLPVNCSSQREIPNEDHDDDKESDEHEVKWFFVSMVLGFVVGFWGVVAPLFIFRSWRHTYYGFFDGVWYKIQSWWW